MPQLLLGSLDLMADPFATELNTSMGQWVSVTTTVESLFVDGSVVTGDATGNREVVLQVLVSGDTRADLAAACEALVAEANAASNTLTLVPGDGPAQVYETFRASTLDRIDDERLGALQRRYELHLPARPFVRSDVREQASAAPPGVSIDSMEAVASGVVMQRQIPGMFIAGWGNTATGGPTVDPAVAPLSRLVGAGVQGGALTVMGGTVADTTAGPNGSQVAQVTPSGAGTVTAEAAAVSTADDYVTADWAAVHDSPSGVYRSFQAGLEWLDGSDLVVRADWGPVLSINNGSSTAPRAVSVASPRPSSAAKARPVLRYTAAESGEKLNVYAVTVQPSTGGTVAPLSSPVHDGAGSAGASVLTTTDRDHDTYYERYATPYVRRALPAALDVSGQVMLRAWFMYQAGSNLLSPPSIRLWDSAGNWSRFDFSTSLAAGAWVQLSAALASPSESSTTPCDLTQVAAWDLTVALWDTTSNADAFTLNAYLDTLTAGPADAPNMSPRGTVLTLDGIKGSARTTASITVTNALAMTDWLVACIDGTEGEPLLTVAANAASGSGYDGVYSILAALTPANAVTSPTLTISQKIGVTTVATRVLTGVQQAGNRYIDYGAVELPLVKTPVENTSVTYDFTLAPAQTQYAELLVIDVDASMAWLPNLSTARKVGMVDEPDLLAGLGQVWVGDLTDRTDARAPMTAPVLSRPLHVQSPSTRVLVYSTTGAPSVLLFYWPRHLVEPTS